jgi:hypothetical protein
MENNFKALSQVDCGEFIEKKGQLSYISWASAWQKLCEHCPDATYEHHDWITTPSGEVMVFCTVTVGGVSHKAHLPVLDHKNKPIQSPNVFQLNTSMQRCFAKAISMHGLGLYVYRGEDLPPAEEIDHTAMYEEFLRQHEENKHNCAVWYSQLSEEEMNAVKEGSPKGKKTATHQLTRDLVTQMHANFDDYAEKLAEAVQNGDVMFIEQLQGELEDYERACVKDRLSSEVKSQYKQVMINAKANKE